MFRFISFLFLLFIPHVLHGGVEDSDFLRGDANNDGQVDLSDSVFIRDYVNNQGPAPDCLDAADADDDGDIDQADVQYIIDWKYYSGSPPPSPGPATCGEDPTADSLSCDDHVCQN